MNILIVGPQDVVRKWTSANTVWYFDSNRGRLETGTSGVNVLWRDLDNLDTIAGYELQAVVYLGPEPAPRAVERVRAYIRGQ